MGSWAIVEVLRLTGIRHEEMLVLIHHSFIAYALPTTGEVVPMLRLLAAPRSLGVPRIFTLIIGMAYRYIFLLLVSEEPTYD